MLTLTRYNREYADVYLDNDTNPIRSGFISEVQVSILTELTFCSS